MRILAFDLDDGSVGFSLGSCTHVHFRLVSCQFQYGIETTGPCISQFLLPQHNHAENDKLTYIPAFPPVTM